MRLTSRLCLVGFVFLVLNSVDARAGFRVDVQFNDSASLYSAYYDLIATGVQAAADDWGSRIVSSGSLNLQVNFTNERTASAVGKNFTQVGTEGGYRVMQSGALTAITTGGMARGGGIDAVLNIGVDFLTKELWFDPNPAARAAAIPSMKVDAQSVFLHEFGHIFFMTGYRDRLTGALPGSSMSTFDRYMITDGDNWYFNGPRATALYGGPVPLTYGNNKHLGNRNPRPGSDLILDLMNGVVTYYQHRYSISDLDLAIAADTGIQLVTDAQPPAVPEPSSMALLGVGILVVGFGHRATRPHHQAARRAA